MIHNNVIAMSIALPAQQNLGCFCTGKTCCDVSVG